MMDDIFSLERRRFLQQSTGVAALAVTFAQSASAPKAIAPSGATAAGATGSDVQTLVLYRVNDAASVAFAELMQGKGMQAVALGDDVVRQWRDQLQALVVEQGYRMTGRTGYADWFILRGLAAEHRIFPQHEQQPTRHNFDWVI